MKQKIYIIKIENKYFFNRRTLVQLPDYAHRFYAREQAKKAFKSSEFAEKEYELIPVAEYEDIIY